MAGTQQTKPVKFVAVDFRLNRIAKPISSKSKPILTHTTKVRLTTIEWQPEATRDVGTPAACPPSALMRQIGWVEEGMISGSS
jgi:hypothetical protein